MLRLLVALALLAASSAAAAFTGSFPVCVKEPQYVELRIYPGSFPPATCAWEMAKAGNPLPLLLTVTGFLFIPACGGVDSQGHVVMIMDPMLGDPGPVGHELRHAFPPEHSHPFYLPFVDLPCEWQH